MQKKNTTSKKKAARKRARPAKEDTTYFWRHTDERLQAPTTQFTDAEMETFAEYMSAQFERDPGPIAVLMLTLRRIANLVEFSEHTPDAIDAVDFINDKLFAHCDALDLASEKFELHALKHFNSLLKGESLIKHADDLI